MSAGPTLVIDANDATQDAMTFAALRTFFGGDRVRVSSLKQGDISIQLPTGLLLIERKRPSDLLQSIGDGRIFQQTQRMVNTARFPVIVIQGSLGYNRDDMAMADGRPTHWHGSSVRSAIRAVMWAGCSVDQVPQGEFPKHVAELINLASKPDHYHVPSDRFRPPPIDFFGGETERMRKRVALLSSIPGLGPKKAQALLDWVSGMTIYGKFTEQRESDADMATLPNAQSPVADVSAYKAATSNLPVVTVESSELFSRVCDALEWATAMHTLEKEDRPDGWGPTVINAVRAALELAPNEYMKVERLSEPIAPLDEVNAEASLDDEGTLDNGDNDATSNERPAAERTEQPGSASTGPGTQSAFI